MVTFGSDELIVKAIQGAWMCEKVEPDTFKYLAGGVGAGDYI